MHDRELADATAPEVEWRFNSGDHESLLLTRKADDGSRKDISGYTFYLTIRDEPSTSSNVLVQKSEDRYINASEGETVIRLSPSDTQQLSGVYYFEVEEQTNKDIRNTLFGGPLIVEQDKTNIQ